MEASGNSKTAKATYTIAINTAPGSGILTVSPTSGTSLSTDFLFSTGGWVDGDTPFTYQYAYSTKPDAEFSDLEFLNVPSTEFELETWLISNDDNAEYTIYVIAYDAF